ncbi:MAG: hypothetical protein GY722_26525, partial [bacterium]|nr:hypothetical protein [bacterium]
PADGVPAAAEASVATLELLGSQGSYLEGEALAAALGGEHLTAVTALTRAVREGQALTRVDASNVDAALAAADLGEDAEASILAGVGSGRIAWIHQSQLLHETWDAAGYVLEDPSTGAGGYFVTYERLLTGLEADITFHTPLDLAVVTEPTDVVATIDSEHEIASWTLSTKAADGGEAVVLAAGSGTVTAETLAQFDPTLLLNGLYDLVLTASDALGQTASKKTSLVVEGQMKVGNFTLSFVDLAIQVSGLDLEIIRTYDSRDQQPRDFGVGWRLDIRQGSYRNNRTPGDGWQLQTGFLPCDTVLESKSHLTVVRLSDQEVYRFALRLANGVPSTSGGCFATARFDFIDGPLPGTTLDILGNDQVFYENGTDQVINVDTFETYEPEDVRLTTRDGRIFELDLSEGVTLVEDLNGNQLSITPAGITHSSGRGIAFERDAEGRIERIVDPRGNDLLYTYDAAGDLEQVTNQAGHETRFVYEDHRIVDVFDPRGVRAVRTDYDADGRLVSVTDALGNPIQLQHDLEVNQEIVTTRLGLVKVFTYDSRGNVVEEIDEAGERTLRSYDARDRLLTETDPNQNTTTFDYDLNGNLLSVVDPLGNTTQFGDYDALGNPWAITDLRGKVTHNTYDGRGNLLTTRDPLVNLTNFTYDSKGQLETETDAEQSVTGFGYDDFGNQTSVTDALGHETSSTYDASGNLRTQTTARTLPDGTIETLVTTFTVDELGRTTRTDLPDGSFSETTYNLLGTVKETEDALGHVTSFEYDDAGRHTKTLYPDTTFEGRTYDLEGRLLTVRNRAAKVTSFEYDPVGRLKKTIFPGGAFTESVYDDAGRLLTLIDARGYATIFGYDNAGRRTTVTNALEQITTFRYDPAGNQIEVEDPLDHITHFEYDDAGRLEKITLPDGKWTTTEYDALGRLRAEVDQALVRTEFRYDAVGRLIEVKDALDGITTYGYDEVGNRVSQTDANEHTTRFEYDAVGRQTKRILPDGSFETFTYDAVGNRETRTDFNGITTTYEYDTNSRLLRHSYPAGDSVRFTYTPMGRRETVIDARGVTRYFYDDRGRLERQTVPEGYELSYSWDDAGNRKSISTLLADGTTFGTTYAYDVLGRMETVTDSRGGVYRYVYDDAGQRESLSYPNGVVTSYAYDPVGRLEELRTEASDGTVIQSYDYTLGPTGNREAVAEWDGTVRSYGYDDLSRLRNERVEDGDGALVYQNVFAYDPVGNRLTQDRMAADGSVEAVVYGYDVRDRLLTESSAVRDIAYGWDLNGNQTSKAGSNADGSDVGSTYSWDFENRLMGAVTADGTVAENVYDSDGVWVESSVTEPAEALVVRRYVVDTSGGLSQVVAEVDGSGSLAFGYVRRGGDLLAQEAGGGVESFVHAEGIGTIRALTDGVGGISDSWAYTAFGEETQRVGSTVFRYGHTGEQVGATGLTYLRARWMDPEVGRFESMDSFPGVNWSPITLGKYLYANSDPIQVTDPSGYVGLREALVVVAILAVAFVALIKSIDLSAVVGQARIVCKDCDRLNRSLYGDVLQLMCFLRYGVDCPEARSRGLIVAPPPFPNTGPARIVAATTCASSGGVSYFGRPVEGCTETCTSVHERVHRKQCSLLGHAGYVAAINDPVRYPGLEVEAYRESVKCRRKALQQGYLEMTIRGPVY